MQFALLSLERGSYKYSKMTVIVTLVLFTVTAFTSVMKTAVDVINWFTDQLSVLHLSTN